MNFQMFKLDLEKADGPDIKLQTSGGSDGKASAYNAGVPGLIPGLGRSSGEGNSNPL